MNPGRSRDQQILLRIAGRSPRNRKPQLLAELILGQGRTGPLEQFLLFGIRGYENLPQSSK